jgi:ADP-heptose:LPS heptosyltransferase
MLTNKEQVKSFAIFVRSSYGDLLMTDPLIKYIKRLNINHKITLFVEDKNFQLVEFMDNVDSFYKIPSKGNKYLFFIFYGLKYRKNKYDVSIAAKTGVGSANGFFQYMLGAKKQISYVSKNKTWTDMLVNCPITYSAEIYHRQHYALGVLQLLDSKLTKIPHSLYPELKSQKNTGNNLKTKLLISVSNNRESCRLNNETTASIINILSKEFQFDIHISTLESDYDKAVNLKKKIIQHSIINQTPLLKDFIKLINAMDICFFGEGGSMHLAASLGVSQVVLFGFTSPITWAPLSNTATVLSDKSNVNNIPKNKILEALKKKLQNIEK